MILPIRLFGDPSLREPTHRVAHMNERLETLIADMIDTMHNANGIGLAAPQVGRSERVFVVDIRPLLESMPDREIAGVPHQPMVFINPAITAESEEEEEYEEGCLSIPDILEDVVRPSMVRIEYLDGSFTPRQLEVGDLLARVIQHEYDHLEGVLFLDRISAFRRQMLKRKLRDIARGETAAEYPTEVNIAA
ncbi:MAG: peptide deformylase [Bacteroidota bacterium]|nr:peptide deformylase [Bacteroidota bacterium]MDE2833469.1 peptide deformylase [Bacteroidota bacterium]